MPRGVYDHYKIRKVPPKVENWDQYKDLEYYPDRVCKCGCGGRIKVKLHHEYHGVPKFISGHNLKGKPAWNRGLTKNSDDSRVANWIQSLAGKKKPRKSKICYEVRFCKCGCGRSKEVPINSPWKYFRGHGNRIPREIRFCECGCGETFECNIRSKQRFVHGHNSRNGGGWSIFHQKHPGATSGENSYNWLGGISNFPYSFEFNEEFKTLIRERDDNTCQLCGRTKEEEGTNLIVHHIHYDKENTCLDECDFITLCRSCNSKVNFNREYWTEFFRERLELYAIV